METDLEMRLRIQLESELKELKRLMDYYEKYHTSEDYYRLADKFDYITSLIWIRDGNRYTNKIE